MYFEECLLKKSTQDANAASFSKAAKVNRGLSKVSGAYVNTHWDLVDAAEADEEIFENLEEEDLPEQMKEMSIDEQKNYIGEQKQKRGDKR